jgi:tetratricopeptide (TPR) repeat protein
MKKAAFLNRVVWKTQFLNKSNLSIFVLLVLIVLNSCSSAPKNTGDIYHLRTLAEKELELGNSEAGRGNFEVALSLLNECKRRAILVDDMSLLIRCGFSLGNVLFTIGRMDEAFAEWNEAVARAQVFGNSELLAAGRIYYARGRLLAGGASAQSILNEVNREAANIKNERLFIALSWQVRGLALRELGSFREAEDAVRRSLEIHEREMYLENASYDWFLIGSIRSLSGNFSGALQALDASIAIDRRIENSWGLGASWRAKGDVHRRAGNNREALEAWQRARAIFAAMGNQHEVAEIDNRIMVNR